ncbi:MAG: hypothetical protein QM660_15235 [Dysgonomonas sp.]
MISNLLLPHSFRRVGWILLIPATILGILVAFFDFEFSFLDCKVLALLSGQLGENQWKFFNVVENNLTNELAAILFIIAAWFVGFSKEKIEDEYISKIRLDALLWATYISYAFLIFCFIFIYDFLFFRFMTVSLFSILIIFIIRFNILLYRSKKDGHEK